MRTVTAKRAPASPRDARTGKKWAALGGMHQMTLFDSSGNSLGTLTHADQGGNYPATLVSIGITGAELESSGYDIWFGPVIINSNATFPVGP